MKQPKDNLLEMVIKVQVEKNIQFQNCKISSHTKNICTNKQKEIMSDLTMNHVCVIQLIVDFRQSNTFKV